MAASGRAVEGNRNSADEEAVASLCCKAIGLDLRTQLYAGGGGGGITG